MYIFDSLYKSIKEELRRRRGSTKYFNRSFFNSFCDAIRTSKRNREGGVDDSYTDPSDPNVTLYHSFDAIYASDLYNKNSGTYREFLSIFASLAKEY